MGILVDLHQRRQLSLGEPGCFASKRFTAFHREVTSLMLVKGQLLFRWLALDGRPAAAEYILSSDGVNYVYQGGIAPELLDLTPGVLLTQIMLRRTIEQGGRAVDFLRGDEPYKRHFRASASPCLTLHLIPDRPLARLRAGLWSAGRKAKRCMTYGLRDIGLLIESCAANVRAERPKSPANPPDLRPAEIIGCAGIDNGSHADQAEAR
jgi:CelD/BcsL family acetyltransferase involved in cellulose biosynthesis